MPSFEYSSQVVSSMSSGISLITGGPTNGLQDYWIMDYGSHKLFLDLDKVQG